MAYSGISVKKSICVVLHIFRMIEKMFALRLFVDKIAEKKHELRRKTSNELNVCVQFLSLDENSIW